jgi:hypothetical protein
MDCILLLEKRRVSRFDRTMRFPSAEAHQLMSYCSRLPPPLTTLPESLISQLKCMKKNRSWVRRKDEIVVQPLCAIFAKPLYRVPFTLYTKSFSLL